uniref:Uncharacterized protein n=1 Tax=Oryza punctata TaxID=4537 RepID=A0A0E0M3Z7_ORYPU
MALCAPQLACGLFGLGGVFTAAELAVADQLVQLSCSSGGDEAASSSSSSTTSSPRSVNTCAATAASGEEVGEEIEEFTGMAAEMELDRRARKRYRLLSELYAATAPPSATKRAAAAACSSSRSRKRKRDDESPVEAEIAVLY